MKLSAIILAAGGSRRMGDPNKLLLQLNGKPMITKKLKRSNISKPTVLNKFMFILSENSIRKYN